MTWEFKLFLGIHYRELHFRVLEGTLEAIFSSGIVYFYYYCIPSR